jgi:type VI secretion system secreted protein Hcp
MAVDYFLKIDGIDGESKDSVHKNVIDLMSWSWGASQTGSSAAGGGSAAGKVSMQDFHFVMKVNKSTPKLILVCAGGDHIKKATLTCRKAGTTQQEFLVYNFYDFLVSSYQTGGSTGGDEIPSEQVSLNYSKMDIQYKEQQADGSLGGPIMAGWDLKLNTKV